MRGPEGLPELRSILVATELNEEGRLSVQSASHLLPGSEGELHLVHSLPEGSEGDDLAEKWGEMALELESAGFSPDRAHFHFPIGPAHRQVHLTAERLGVQLTVLGRHRPRRALDGLLGSTADRVIRTSDIPCLVVNRPVTRAPRRLMVASDLSPHADGALAVAARWAAGWAPEHPEPDAADEPVVTIHLVGISDFARPGYRPVSLTEGLGSRAAATASSTGPLVAFEVVIRSAALAPEGIMRVAEELKPDLVFLGTHGHGPFLRTLYGSVTSEVIRTLPLATVVVPPPGPS